MNGRIPPALPYIGEEEKQAVLEVLSSGQIAAGPKVEEFEKRFAAYIGVKEAVAVSSGTAALQVALLASGIGPGCKVMIPSYSFFATASAVMTVGAEPIFTDIDPVSFCIDVQKMEDIDAVIPVHIYGQTAEMNEINTWAEEDDVKVIEDACQAHGAEYHDKKAGSLGHVGCFSFYATKNMFCGEGGMITTDDTELADKARLLRAHGRNSQGIHESIGYNFLMTDIEAAIGLVQLDKLDDINEARRVNARIIDSELAELEGYVQRPVELQERKHVYHQYALRVPPDIRDRLVNGMQKAGVGVRHGYTMPMYRQPAIDADLEHPETEKACREVVWVPVYPQLDRAQMSRIAFGLKQFLK